MSDDDEDSQSNHSEEEEVQQPVTLELKGNPSPPSSAIASENRDENSSSSSRISIRRIDDNVHNQIRIVISLPRLVDTTLASHATDSLYEDLSDLDGNFFIEKVKLAGVRFTVGGIAGITNFLSNHASDVKKLVLNDIVLGRIVPADEENFLALCQTFQNAQLDIIDLSHNAIGAYLWQAFERQRQVKTLVLHDVEMDNKSFQSLGSVFSWADSLSNFHVSNLTQTGRDAVEVVNNMLSACNNMRTFAWISDVQVDDIPAIGLKQLAINMFRNSLSCLKNLELSGGIINFDGPSGAAICEALESFHKLQVIKIRHAGLNSDKIQRLIAAMRTSRPPLSCIDFSCNNIGDVGAHWIAQLACLKAVTKNLRILNLEHNALGQQGALEVVDTFASKSIGFRLLLNGNPFDSGTLALSLASAKHKAEKELAETRKERDRLQAEKADAQSNLRDLLSAQSTMVADMHRLQEEAKQLEEDKEGLVKAFSVLGMMQHVKERDMILRRLSRLEESVLGDSSHRMPPQTSSRTPADADDGPESTYVSKTASTDEPKRVLQRNGSRQGSVAGVARRSMRPASARGLLVKAASERWKNLISKPAPSMNMTRAASTKSLAEFLSASDSNDQTRLDDGSLDVESIQTTPASLGDLRGRFKRDDSSQALGSDGHGSFRSLPAFDMTHSVIPPARRGLNKDSSSLESLPK